MNERQDLGSLNISLWFYVYRNKCALSRELNGILNLGEFEESKWSILHIFITHFITQPRNSK